MSDAPEYTKAEYMRLFKVSDTTVDRHVKAGKIVKRTAGRRVFYRPAEAEPPPPDPLLAILEINLRLVEEVRGLHAEVAALRAALQPLLPPPAPPPSPWRRLIGRRGG